MGAEGSSPTTGPTTIQGGGDEHEDEIVNGVEVRDIVSGFQGVVLCITEWWNGCTRLSVYPRELKDDGELSKACTFDIEQLEYVGPGLTAEVSAEALPSSGGDREDAGARAEVP